MNKNREIDFNYMNLFILFHKRMQNIKFVSSIDIILSTRGPWNTHLDGDKCLI